MQASKSRLINSYCRNVGTIYKQKKIHVSSIYGHLKTRGTARKPRKFMAMSLIRWFKRENRASFTYLCMNSKLLMSFSILANKRGKK